MQKELIVKWKIKETEIDSILKLLPELAEKTKAEPGNITYNIFQSEGDKNEFILHERYQSEEALEAHKSSAHYQGIVVGQIIPYLELREVLFVKKVL